MNPTAQQMVASGHWALVPGQAIQDPLWIAPTDLYFMESKRSKDQAAPWWKRITG